MAKWKKDSHRPQYVEAGLYRCRYCGLEGSGELQFDDKGNMMSYDPKFYEACPEYPGPWNKWRINRSFMANLSRTFHEWPFTNQAAYVLYARDHAKTRWNGERTDHTDVWLRMNVRNHLSAAAHRGMLIRLGPGRYQFPPGIPDWELCKAPRKGEE